MDAEAILAWVDTLVLSKTGQRLNDLQRTILWKVWQGKKYFEIALSYGCTEGHVKDVSSDLWKLLSKHLGEKITKTNCRSALVRHLHTPSPTLHTPSLHLPLSPSPHFIGRTAAIAYLNTLIHQGNNVIVIQGEGGLGKTTLAQQFLQTQEFELVLELLMAKETQNITAAERVVEEWLKQDLGLEPGIEFGVTLGRLKRQLHTRRIGILIDNLEPALDQQGRLLAAHRSYVELLRILADSRVQSVTLITSRDRLCESSLNVTHYRLPGLDQSAWQQYFCDRQIAVDASTLQKMHQSYGGNAKAMGILSGIIQEDFAGDMVAYWHEYEVDLLGTTDVKDLVTSQANRLQNLDPQAYRLFCRLGCYRYQDVPSISIQGLRCLLWDVPSAQQRQTIASLRNRSLVECQHGEYWLHPVIRAEAITRLRASDEWQIVNQKAAEFWTSSVQTIQATKDALQALEAYYHCIAVQDYEAASQVILRSRNNQWQQFLPLGSTLYRMGLLQPVLAAILPIIPHIQSHNHLSELYNILGDLYWITGKIHAAIACQEKTISLATQALQTLTDALETKHQRYYLKMLEVDSRLSIGLYQIDLWELEFAALQFQQVIDLATNTAHHRWAEKATVCLALVKSYSGLKEESTTLADVVYQSLLDQHLTEQTGRFAYFIQILGQTYVNLGEFAQATELFQKVLTFAEAGHYTQTKAKALIGLAEIQRQQARFDVALNNHLTAIDLLDKIGAKCDLAQAYFQLGLTYQSMGKASDSQTNCDRAIQLFTEMQAPKQVKKVLNRGLDI
ncbi:NB-ARC domain-containing protein [Kovacikia minuta CCNUW1]|uniref:NB-ARC domain-containing protein n=1 Tax=Kovacikia minuta TaxID=2931930 RepID=UPI001CCFCE10|nr:NB-ARC domain-containing protein [Kovacikia minuta]UBF26699.1 NB-ARC domain-containing protein [Kovacikia minuta CCNUW1]